MIFKYQQSKLILITIKMVLHNFSISKTFIYLSVHAEENMQMKYEKLWENMVKYDKVIVLLIFI